MDTHQYHWVEQSSNKKIGQIPASTTSEDSCPPACPLIRKGCLGDNFPLSLHWRKVSSGERGISLDDLCRRIKALPKFQLWRHDVVGDLPGAGNRLNVSSFRKLVRANRRRRGFTYTHKPLWRIKERQVIRWANAEGFTVNLSGNDLAHADKLADLDIGPVTTLLPADQLTNTVTPAGRTVVVCPAVTRKNVTCRTCGLCAVAKVRDRGGALRARPIVGFPAGGTRWRYVDAIASIFSNQ